MALKFSIAVALVNPKNRKEILVVKRPIDDDKLPNVWGLPAISLMKNELPEAAVRRLGREKLDVEIEPMETIGIKYADKGEYQLILLEIKCKLLFGKPDVWRAETKATKYVDQRWTEDYSILKEAADMGSLCSQIFFEAERRL